MVRISNITNNENKVEFTQEHEKKDTEIINQDEVFNEIYRNNIKVSKIVNNVPLGRISNNSTNINYNNSINKSENVLSNENSNKIDRMINLLEKQVGKKYVWGTEGPDTFDCSGLVKYVYSEVMGITLPRISYEQAEFGKDVERENLKPGDLVFFDTMNKGRVSHVGIYIGNNEFIHAANSRKGVIKSELKGYYADKYLGAKRPYN